MSFVRLKPGDAGLPQNNSGHTRTMTSAAVHAALIMVRVFASRSKSARRGLHQRSNAGVSQFTLLRKSGDGMMSGVNPSGQRRSVAACVVRGAV